MARLLTLSQRGTAQFWTHESSAAPALPCAWQRSRHSSRQFWYSHSAPVLFSTDGRVAATHADGSLITLDAPARPGEVIVVYGAGLGMGWGVPRMITGIDLSVLLAFVNLGVLAWLARRLWTESAVTLPGLPD